MTYKYEIPGQTPVIIGNSTVVTHEWFYSGNKNLSITPVLLNDMHDVAGISYILDRRELPKKNKKVSPEILRITEPNYDSTTVNFNNLPCDFQLTIRGEIRTVNDGRGIVLADEGDQIIIHPHDELKRRTITRL